MMATHVRHKPMPLLHKPSSGHVETHTETGKYLCVLCAAARALASADVDRARTMRVRAAVCVCHVLPVRTLHVRAAVPREPAAALRHSDRPTVMYSGFRLNVSVWAWA